MKIHNTDYIKQLLFHRQSGIYLY